MNEFDVSVFLNLHLRVERNLSTNTVKAYRYDLEHFLNFINKNGVDNVRSVDYDLSCLYLRTLHDAGLSPVSINRRLAAIRTYYNYLLDNKIIKKQPGFLLLETVRSGFKLPGYLTESETNALLESVNEKTGNYRGGFSRELWNTLWIRDRAILEILYATGARVSEITTLENSAINFKENTIRVMGKGSRERIIPFGRYAKKWMLRYKKKVRPILKTDSSETGNKFFLRRNGRPMSRVAIFNIVKRAASIAGIEKNIYPHILRHSCATHLMNHSMPIELIAELLGHKSFNTTQIYTHVSIERLHRTLKIHHPRYHLEVNMKYKPVNGEPKKLKRINVHLRNDQIEKLNEIAASAKVDRSQLIREAVSEKIERLKQDLH